MSFFKEVGRMYGMYADPYNNNHFATQAALWVVEISTPPDSFRPPTG